MIKICAYKKCGKQFDTNDNRRNYCCKEHRVLGHSDINKACIQKRREREREAKVKELKAKKAINPDIVVCDREECRFFNVNIPNNCAVLVEVYVNSSQCSFFKKKENDK